MTVMTRLGVVGTLLTAWLAVAQTPTAPVTEPTAAPTATPDVTPPPPPPPMLAPTVEPTPGPALADRTEPQRYSRFSAGRGGPLFGFSEFLAGMIGGGFLGGALTGSTGSGGAVGGGVYVGAVVGGLLLGGLGIGIQYLHPIGLASAGAIALATGLGGLFGVGLANAIGGNQFRDATLTAALLLGGTQVGALAALLAVWSLEDLNGEDLALMGMTSLYAFILVGLIDLIAASSGIAAWPIFMAPAVGMGLGALWAIAVDMAPGRVLKLTALPCGVGIILFYLGSLLVTTGPNGPQLWGITTLAGVVATFGLTYIFTMEDDAPKTKKAGHGVAAMPTIALMPAGRRNEAIAAGPAMMFTF